MLLLGLPFQAGFLMSKVYVQGMQWEELLGGSGKGAGEARWKGREPSKDSRAPLGALESKSHCKPILTGGRVSGLAHSYTHSQVWSYPTRCPFPGTAAS